MELKDMIYRRKSVRSYTGEPIDSVTIEKIKEFISGIKPLYPDIKVRAEIIKKTHLLCMYPWLAPDAVAIFTENKEGLWENIGFMFQQLDLYLQSLGLGACWIGVAQLNAKGVAETKRDDDLSFAIILTMGYPKGKALRKDASEYRRKSLVNIADQEDERLEPARLAPSSVNSQPWYFVHDDNEIHVYCTLQGLFRSRFFGNMNRIDIGIALSHMYVTNPTTFRFFKSESVQMIKGYEYMGSFSI